MKVHAKLRVTLKLKVNHQCRSFYYIIIVIFDLINVDIYILDFPADIGRKPASPARGSRQLLHAGESRQHLHAG